MHGIRTRLAPLGLVIAATAGTLVATAPVQAQSASEIRAALDIPSGTFADASYTASDPDGVEVLSTPLGGFPTFGTSYLAISTGRAADASLPNSEGNRSAELGGGNNVQGQDLVQVQLRLAAPATATCLTFDFRLLSEEFPEWVGSRYNDAFTAEIVETGLDIQNDQVVAPFNFAFDDNASPISINTTFGLSSGATGTTYDAATPILRAVSPVEASADGWIRVWLTVQDLGDSIYDSTVFVDNFRWQSGGACNRGAAFRDTDGDALPDDWETGGVDVDGNGTVDLDLPAMGADPNHKDLFVETDFMVEDPVCMGTCTGGHDHRPDLAAIARVTQSFGNAPVPNPDGTTGITMHVDAGPASVMNPRTGATWGTRSRANRLPHDEFLGFIVGMDYDWTEFAAIKAANFPIERRDVFHYAVFAHDIDPAGYSGVSRGIPGGDFIVSLGQFAGSVGTTTQQAGTFMHELGHNLDLQHGGDDEDNLKPNYLSVMNYTFQLRGLTQAGATGHFDYSRDALDSLDESALNETAGLTPAASVGTLGTYYYCGLTERRVDAATSPINWDCDTTAGEASVPADVNAEGGRTTLAGWDDWANLRFDGGGVGQLGEDVELPSVTEVIEATREELVAAGVTDAPYEVAVAGPGSVRVVPGTGPHTLVYTVTNDGDLADTYAVTAEAGPHADLGDVPPALTLAPGGSARIEVTVDLPDASAAESVRLAVTSNTNALVLDELVTEVRALTIDAANAADVMRATIDGLTAMKARNAVYARDADQAVAQLRAALAALPGDTPAAILALRKAVTSVEQLSRIAAPADPATAEQARGVVSALTEVARVLARAEIDAAVARGGGAAAIAQANDLMASGDTHRAAGRMEAALNAYREAALKARSS